jgi:hypothetical protein
MSPIAAERNALTIKSTRKRQLWGIVLAAGEGTRVREFLMQLCGGRGIKQFCAVTGRRSMLQHTLTSGRAGAELLTRAYLPVNVN